MAEVVEVLGSPEAEMTGIALGVNGDLPSTVLMLPSARRRDALPPAGF